MRKFILSVLILLGLSTSLYAESLYVRPATGDCTYNGNGLASTCAAGAGQTGAWKGLTSVQWGAGTSSVEAGDTLYLVGGLTYTLTSSEYLRVGASGSSWSSPITITVYGSGAAVLDADDEQDSPIYLQSNDYIIIDGVRGDAVAGDYDYGIKITNLEAGSGGIYQNDYGVPGYLQIKHVEISGSQQTGGDDQGAIRLGNGGADTEISYCYIHGPSSSQLWYVSGIDYWASPGGTSYTNKKIHHNKVMNVYHDGIKSDGNVSIYNNIVLNVEGSGHSDSILVQSGGYAKIYNNYVSSADQQIYLDQLAGSVAHIYIYNNILNNAQGHGIIISTQGGDLDDVRIYNNTIYATGSYCIWKDNESGDLTNVHIVNNIFYSSGGGYYCLWVNSPVGSIVELDYNIYGTNLGNAPDITDWGGTKYTLAELVSNTSFGDHSTYADPVFNDAPSDLTLSASDTIARDRGQDLSAYFTTDKDGNTRSGTWDIGAYEYSEETPTNSITGVNIN